MKNPIINLKAPISRISKKIPGCMQISRLIINENYLLFAFFHFFDKSFIFQTHHFLISHYHIFNSKKFIVIPSQFLIFNHVIFNQINKSTGIQIFQFFSSSSAYFQNNESWICTSVWPEKYVVMMSSSRLKVLRSECKQTNLRNW